MSLKLHHSLGVNPRVVEKTCRLCGKDFSDELVLLGDRNVVATCPHCGTQVWGGCRRGEQCPSCGGPGGGWQRRTPSEHEKVKSFGVCAECKDRMKRGIVLVGAKETADGAVLTGGYVLVKEEALRGVFDEETEKRVLANRCTYVTPDAWERLGLPAQKPTDSGEMAVEEPDEFIDMEEGDR